MTTKTPQKNIPKGWQKRRIKDLLDYERPDKYIVEHDRYINDGIPVLTANKSFVLGYTNERSGIYDNTPAIIFDDFTTDSKFVDFPFKVKSSAIKILKEKQDVDLRFMYEKMKSINFPTGSHKRYYISQYQNLEVAVPPLPEQKKIAEILSEVDEEIQKTDEIIAATEKLKKGLMQGLFTRGIGHTKLKHSELGEIPEGWNLKRLGGLTEKFIGGGTPSRNTPEYWNGKIPWLTVKDFPKSLYVETSSEFITQKGLENSASNIVPKEGVIVAIRVGLGHSFLSKNEIAINQDLRGIIPTKDIMPEYFARYLNYIGPKITSDGSGSTVKGITLNQLKSYLIPVPILDEQKKIVEILRAVDEKILINKKLKAKLTLLKKGLMQDLLSGKVRTINKLMK